MKEFRYTARTAEGRRVHGSCSLQGEQEFFEFLKGSELFLEDYRVRFISESYRRMPKLKTKALIEFCRKFGTMISSGLSITGALQVLYDSTAKQETKNLYLHIYEDLQTGMSLSDAMKNCPGAFSHFFISMVQAGEESGSLDTVFIRMCAHYEKELKLNESVRAAVTYPAILASMAFVIIIALFTFILPDMFKIFEGAELPGLTVAMMSISDFLVKWWYLVLLGVLLIVLFFTNASAIPGVDHVISKFKIKAPVFGKLNLMIYTARLSRSVAMLYSSGVTLLNTIGISSNVLGNAYISRKFTAVIDSVMSGRPLSASLADTKIFDEMFVSMIRVGEESGNLESILESTADYYDLESDAAVKRMISLLEPALLVVLGVVVALVMVSVMLPIYTMTKDI